MRRTLEPHHKSLCVHDGSSTTGRCQHRNSKGAAPVGIKRWACRWSAGCCVAPHGGSEHAIARIEHIGGKDTLVARTLWWTGVHCFTGLRCDDQELGELHLGDVWTKGLWVDGRRHQVGCSRCSAHGAQDPVNAFNAFQRIKGSKHQSLLSKGTQQPCAPDGRNQKVNETQNAQKAKNIH